jgi:pimeloyl-ACP methyl ester carboxylesterase
MTTRTLGALSADDSGRDDGRPPIVLLHGLSFDRHIWSPVVDALRDDDPDRRVIALDLPGHGQSPSYPPHDLFRVADLVHDAMDAAGAAAPVIVGHSISGGIATLYAARHPTAGVVNLDQPPFIEEFAQLVRSLEPDLRGAGFERVWRDVFAASFHTELLPESARALVESNGRPAQGLVLSYWQTVLEQPVVEIQSMMDDAFDQVAHRDIPYLLVLGRELPAVRRAELQRRNPAVQLVEWPDTGHFPHLARPTEFAQLVATLAPPTARTG